MTLRSGLDNSHKTTEEIQNSKKNTEGDTKGKPFKSSLPSRKREFESKNRPESNSGCGSSGRKPLKKIILERARFKERVEESNHERAI